MPFSCRRNVTVRRGAYLVHCASGQVADIIMALESSLGACSATGIVEAVNQCTDIQAILEEASGCLLPSTRALVNAARTLTSHQLANRVRAAYRSRGAAIHPSRDIALERDLIAALKGSVAYSSDADISAPNSASPNCSADGEQVVVGHAVSDYTIQNVAKINNAQATIQADAVPRGSPDAEEHGGSKVRKTGRFAIAVV